MLTNIRLADLLLTTAQQKFTDQNLPSDLYKTIILPVIMHRYICLSLTLREEHRLKAFENRVLKRIFGPKRDEEI
jgi:hypothetical protein